MKKQYKHQEVEQRWQKNWQDDDLYRTKQDSDQEKFYCLVEFPYPSGAGLHVGHVRGYAAQDIISRYKRMKGFNVLYPMGWDAFGLPTENFAIKTGKHPVEVTKDNVAVFKKQMRALGLSFDWSREINTTDPQYYKWTQWIFLQLLKKGLAYKKEMPINWCPDCKIGLANEEVIDGKCERCGAETYKKNMEQWMLAITEYADRLEEDLATVEWPEHIKTQQINWIGRSEGAEVNFGIEGREESVKIFTTRPDTLFGATFMVLAPEHELVNAITTAERKQEVLKYQEQAIKKSDLERTELQKEKNGVFIGAYAVNPVNQEKIPIWIADYVLSGYGTGAIMAVPAHDQRDWDFAKKYGIEIKQVISGGDIEKQAHTDLQDGQLINSGGFDGLSPAEGVSKVTKWLEKHNYGKKKVNYHLRDWIFSRQHYWGEPIPVVYCDKCGMVPLPEDQLPLELPHVERYEPTDTGESPLAAIEDWVNTECPICGGKARRETDTMPNWAGSSWYFLRYIDPHNDEELADWEKMKKWMPVDLYNGGMEHTTLHLLYSRFWNKVLYDIGVSPVSEPYKRRFSHGMILAEDGNKMSKSKGNVINPDDIVNEYGADALRVYEMFMGPYNQPVNWDINGLRGVKKFLDRIYQFDKWVDEDQVQDEVLKQLHKTIKKITEDIENRHFNTAVSASMIFVNKIYEAGCSHGAFKLFLRVFAPFAPHLTEEMWHEEFQEDKSIHLQDWPVYNADLVVDDQVEMVVQINGKVRDKIMISPEAEESEVRELAEQSDKAKKYLAGQEIKKVIFVKGRLIGFVI